MKSQNNPQTIFAMLSMFFVLLVLAGCMTPMDPKPIDKTDPVETTQDGVLFDFTAAAATIENKASKPAYPEIIKQEWTKAATLNVTGKVTVDCAEQNIDLGDYESIGNKINLKYYYTTSSDIKEKCYIEREVNYTFSNIEKKDYTFTLTGAPTTISLQGVPKFSSCKALEGVFSAGNGRGYGYDMMDGIAMTMAGALGAVKTTSAEATTDSSESAPSASPNYSETNVQVQGVDEADIVKTDGEFIYTLTNGNISITKAYPTNDAKLVFSKNLGEFSPSEMFLDGEYLLIFGRTTEKMPYVNPTVLDKMAEAVIDAIMPDMWPPYYQKSFMSMQLYNIANKEAPELVRTIEMEGSYVTARKVESQVYFVSQSYPTYYAYPETGIVPLYRDRSGTELTNDETEFTEIARCGNIGYLPPVQAQSFITVGSFAMDSEDSELTNEVIVGSGYNVYSSKENLYIAEPHYNYNWYYDDAADSSEQREQIIIHKFALNAGKIEYLENGKAPGHILNKF